MNKKRKAQIRDPGAQSTAFRIVAYFGSYAEQISPRKVDYKGMTIVSGGKIITSTTFCLRLGISANHQAPCSPLLLPIVALDISTRPGWPSYFVSWVSVKGERGTKSEKTVMHTLAPASPIGKVRIRTSTTSTRHGRNCSHGRCSCYRLCRSRYHLVRARRHQPCSSAYNVCPCFPSSS